MSRPCRTTVAAPPRNAASDLDRCPRARADRVALQVGPLLSPRHGADHAPRSGDRKDSPSLNSRFRMNATSDPPGIDHSGIGNLKYSIRSSHELRDLDPLSRPLV